jgi:hypothetical protein
LDETDNLNSRKGQRVNKDNPVPNFVVPSVSIKVFKADVDTRLKTFLAI